MSTPDGGPAFPRTSVNGDPFGVGEDKQHSREGMSLRDYFAGQVLAGVFSAMANPQMRTPPQPRETARDAYAFADAMLAQRAKP